MGKEGIFIGLVLIVLLAGFVSATFSYNDHTLEKNYQAGNKIRGSLNISFSSESVDKEFSDNFGNKIKLIDLIKDSGFVENVDFNCTGSGCIADYSSLGMISDPVGLVSAEPVVAGFIIEGGTGISLNSLSFDVDGSASPSCIRQLLVDVLDKNEAFMQSRKLTGESCPTMFYSDCFNRNLGSYTSADITTDPYCQRIRLPPAPDYEIGAEVTEISEGKLKMELYDLDESFLGSCELPDVTGTESVKCAVNYSGLETQEYLFCIKTDFSDPGVYRIDTENKGDVCGTAQLGSGIYTIDFKIFANSMKFDSPSLEVDDGSFLDLTGEFFLDYLDKYMGDKYGGDCSDNCVFPFEFSGVSQDLTFSSPLLSYNSDIGTTFSLDRMHLLEKKEARLSSGDLIIDLSKADFEIPIGSTADEFELYFGGELVFDEDIEISEGFEFDVFPKIVLIGVNTEFEVVTEENISSASWDFGDGATETTTETRIIHKYDSAGEYIMEVVLTNEDGVTFLRTFTIDVGEPRDSAEILLDSSEQKIANLSKRIKLFPLWVQNEITKQVDVSQINSSIVSLRKAFNNATTNDDYNNIVSSLIALGVPSSVDVGSRGSLPLLVGSVNINTDYIESLSGEDVPMSEESRLKSNIASWMDTNYGGSIDFEIISSFVNSDENELLTKVEIDLDFKGAGGEQAYLIVGYPINNIVFKENYSAESADGGAYVPLSGSDETIEFIIPESVTISELGIYISPSIDALGVYEEIGFIERIFPWGGFITAIIILIIVMFIVYILLQEWYKRYYERHLFPNPTDLYNLINFVYNARKAGLDDKQARNKLKQKGWSGEQIAYATKKLDGKRTGMWEIPIFRPFERRKVQAEIAKRQARRQ